MTTPRWSGPREAALLALLYALLALAAIKLARQPGSVATVWFANAVGMAFVATAGPLRMPAMAAAVVAGNVLANLAFGDPLLLSMGFSLANATEVCLGGWLIRRVAMAHRFSESTRALLSILAFGALLPPLLGATLGAATLHTLGYAGFAKVWPNWYIGDVVGTVAVLPFVLSWRQLGWKLARRQLFNLPVAIALLMVTGVALLSLASLPYPFVFASLPVIASALLLAPLASYATCAWLAVTVVVALDVGLMAPAASVVVGHHLLIFLPALMSVVPAMLLTVVQEKQRRASRSLSALTSATEDMMVFFDLEGKVRVINRAWENYWQRTADEVLGRSVLEVVPGSQRLPEMASRVARALAGETVLIRVEQEFPLRGRRSIQIAYQPAFGPEGECVGVVFTGHDVTDLLRTQHELQARVEELGAANQSLEQFARITSHDLREPLNTVVQFVNLIEQAHDSELSGPARHYFGLIKQGASRMRVMLDDLLQYVRLERGEPLPLQPVALESSLNEVLAGLAASIETRRAEVTVGALPVVLGQPSLLCLLFQNLVSNALKFTPAERVPVVRVSALGNGAEVTVTVEDNGIGISADDQRKLFAPFKRLHARRRFEGTGLGLAICKRAATAMGARIEIESQLGVGSRFAVILQRSA